MRGVAGWISAPDDHIPSPDRLLKKPSKGIVDPRCAETGLSLAIAPLIDVHLIKCDTCAATSDVQYFISKFQAAEAKFLAAASV